MNFVYYFYRIPMGTSVELTDLLMGLLRRNSKDRMSFDNFFCHAFLQRAQTPQSSNNDIVPPILTANAPYIPPKLISPHQHQQQQQQLHIQQHLQQQQQTGHKHHTIIDNIIGKFN